MAEISSHFSSFSPLKKLGYSRTKALNRNLDLITKSFDETILRGLKSLNPPSLSLTWLSSALRFLSSAHADARALISNLEVKSLNDSLASYLDDSVKILDLCNCISSVIERLRHRLLRVKVLLNLLSTPDSQKIRRAKESLCGRSDPEIRPLCLGTNLEVLVKNLVASVADNAPRGNISATSKVIRRTIQAVGILTLFVAGVLLSAISGSSEVASIRVPPEFLWADSLNESQSTISAELKRRFSGEGRKAYLVEIDDVEGRTREVGDVIDDVEKLGGAVKKLERVTEILTEGLDSLSNGVNEMFHTVLCTRSGMLEKLRVGPTKLH